MRADARSDPDTGVRPLAHERALGRIATVVSEDATPEVLFAAVAAEVAEALGVPAVTIGRYGSDRTLTVLAKAGSAASMRSAVEVPVMLHGAVWGRMSAGTPGEQPLPADTEERLGELCGLVTLAIAYAEARDRLRRLADDQMALRRVATLVAEAVPAAELLEAVVQEIERVLGAPSVTLLRYEPDRTATVLASHNSATAARPANASEFSVGSRWPLDGPGVTATVLDSGRAARVDEYAGLSGTIAEGVRSSGLRSGVGVPIVVDGHVWGVVVVGTPDPDPLPAGLEARLRDFTELVAIAISDAESRDRRSRLTEQQAALRRVATLAAEDAAPAEIFAAVTEEIVRIADVSAATISRFEPDSVVVEASFNDPGFPVGSRWPLEAEGLQSAILAAGRAASIEDLSALEGAVADAARATGIGASVGAPILVDGSIWGMLAVGRRRRRESLPVFGGSYSGRLVLSAQPAQDIEALLAPFTELIAIAISKAQAHVSNAAAQAELIASRARIVTAGDEARRRFERNLHDGAQQRLIALGLDLQRVQGTLGADHPDARAELESAQRALESVFEEVREVSRGLHPAHLSRGGLEVALRIVSRRSPIPVDLHVDLAERPAAALETAVYYVVSEALTNAIKHSRARAVSIAVGREGAVLRAKVSDDGVGGAVAESGSGLMGLHDRVEALGGSLAVDSPPGGGTSISIELPIAP